MDPAAKAHAFVADLDAPELAEADRHHLERVLRLRRGDSITVSDGAGRRRRARFGPALEPVDAIESEPAPQPTITIGFALVKGGRPEMVVQKLTELGVDRIVPFVADRSVVQWDAERAMRHHERLMLVAREAAMQSRRSWLPVVEPLARFDDLVERADVALADRKGDPPSLLRTTVLIGPEGGWSDRERAFETPAIRVAMHVLRAETAAFAVATTLCGMRSALFEPIARHRG